jgi:hypothetical protein
MKYYILKRKVTRTDNLILCKLNIVFVGVNYVMLC